LEQGKEIEVKIIRGFKTQLKVNNKQRTLLMQHCGARRFTYNWGLSRRIDEYKTEKKSSNAIKQHKELNALKKTDFPWMYDVSKCAMQEGLRDLDKSYGNFFRRVKKGETPGFPRFKKKGMNESFRLTGSIHIQESRVKLPRLGWITLYEKD